MKNKVVINTGLTTVIRGVLLSSLFATSIAFAGERHGYGHHDNAHHGNAHHGNAHHGNGHHGNGHHGNGHHGNGHHKHHAPHYYEPYGYQPPRYRPEYIRYDYAHVERVDPIVAVRRTSRPRQNCWTEQVAHQSGGYPASHTGTVLGGLVGAAVGNSVGHHSSNKQVGAVAGAILGSSIGYDLSRHNGSASHVYYTNERQCEVSHGYDDREEVTGYRVIYRYKGVRHSTQTDYHPGRRIKIRVSETPYL